MNLISSQKLKYKSADLSSQQRMSVKKKHLNMKFNSLSIKYGPSCHVKQDYGHSIPLYLYSVESRVQLIIRNFFYAYLSE